MTAAGARRAAARPSPAPGPPVDPRIEERRARVRRDEARRRLRILVLGGGLVSAVLAGHGVTRSPLLDVDTVAVDGGSRTSATEVARAAGLNGRRQLADVDPVVAADRIERLPWVYKATVTRHWPGRVEVALLERTPVAAVAVAGADGAAGGWALVDGTGRVLEHTGALPEGMATVEVPDVAPPPGARVAPPGLRAIAVLEQLPLSLQDRVTRVVVVPPDHLELALADGPPVRFGPAVQVRAKLVALATVLGRKDLRGVTAIDVRVPTAPVLTRQ